MTTSAGARKSSGPELTASHRLSQSTSPHAAACPSRHNRKICTPSRHRDGMAPSRPIRQSRTYRGLSASSLSRRVVTWCDRLTLGFRSIAGMRGWPSPPSLSPAPEVLDDHCRPICCPCHDPACLYRSRTARARRVPGRVPRLDQGGLRAGPAPVHHLVPNPRVGVDHGQRDFRDRTARRAATARNDASQAGSNCSAMVELALTRSRLRRPARKAAIPAAASSSRAAHSAITVPSAVRLEPRGSGAAARRRSAPPSRRSAPAPPAS